MSQGEQHTQVWMLKWLLAMLGCLCCSGAPEAGPVQLQTVQAVIGCGVVVQLLIFGHGVNPRPPHLDACRQ